MPSRNVSDVTSGGMSPGYPEAFFTNETLRPLARFLCTSNTAEGYAQGLRQLRTYHARL